MIWKCSKIGDHCEITSSKRIFFSEYVEEGVPFYRSKEIIEKTQGQAISEPLFISLEKFQEIRGKYGVPITGDMLLTSVGTIGIPYIVKADDHFYFKDGNLTWFRNFDDSLLPDYLFYWIRSDEGQGILNNSTIGSSQKALTISTLKQLEIPLPPIPIQRRIADILSAYDDLIENNQKQIKLLEEAAQRLYREWFVELRFPGHETTPVVDGVPEGWERVPMGSIVDYEIGGGWGEDEPTAKAEIAAYVIRGTDIYGITHGEMMNIPHRYHPAANLSSRKLQPGDIVFEVSGGSRTEGVAKTLLITDAMLKSWDKPVMCASFCKLMRFPTQMVAQYIFDMLQYMRSIGKTEEFEKKSASSIINYRWKDFLEQLDVLLPSTELLHRYAEAAGGLYNAIVVCSKKIEAAKKARDRLLPKLMSGEVEV